MRSAAKLLRVNLCPVGTGAAVNRLSWIAMKWNSLISMVCLIIAGATNIQAQEPPNVLFIAVDDLRPQLGSYGDSEVLSPNIDRLAARGTQFNRAYCNVPVCGPSRVSVLTGLRTKPNQWKSSDLNQEFITLPGLFKSHGYTTLSNGKVFHHLGDRVQDWSTAPWRSAEIYHGDSDWANYNAYGIWQSKSSSAHIHPKSKRGPYCESADVADDAYQDGKVANKTIDDLKKLKDSGEPFFLACGFWRPHLPFNAPKRYWDLYQRDQIQLADNRYAPENLPSACRTSREIDNYALSGTRKQSDEFHGEARHAYYASVSYVDAQIGKVIAALDDLELADNTIVVLWGDHGWNLGEHDFWGKHNTLNNSVHAPLIVCAPGKKAESRCNQLVEFIDLYPTLCALTGLPIPEHVQGSSFAALLDNPEQPFKDVVFIRWNGCNAVKTNRYLYTEWRKKDKVTHRMLFDHQVDPDENKNIASDPAAADIVHHLSQLLEDQL